MSGTWVNSPPSGDATPGRLTDGSKGAGPEPSSLFVHQRAALCSTAGLLLRCPSSLQRLIRLTAQGKVIYLAEKNAPHRFPNPANPDLFGGVARNFQVFDPLAFLVGEQANRVTLFHESVTPPLLDVTTPR